MSEMFGLKMKLRNFGVLIDGLKKRLSRYWKQPAACSETKKDRSRPKKELIQAAKNEDSESLQPNAKFSDDRSSEIETLQADLADMRKSLQEQTELSDSRLLEIESQKTVLAGAKKTTAAFIDDIIRFRDQLLIFRDGATGDILKFIEMQYKELGKILKKNGMEPLETAAGPFDESCQTVFQTVDTTDKELHMTVSETFRPGYRTADGLLRRQEVIVYKYSGVK